MRHLELKIPPPLVALLCVAAMWYLSRITPAFGLPREVRWLLAGVFVLVGVSFDLRGLLVFLKAKTSINPLKPYQASSLVMTGIYRRTRNPMYVGLASTLVAVAIFLDAPLALIGVGVFVGYITRFQIQPEESALLQKFGEAYRDYCEQVPRWL
jgi:protein-S-isoprenylcysteine O-methyltransferase Ste14